MFEDLKIQRNTRERQLEDGVLNNKQDITNKLNNLATERAKLLQGGYKEVRLAQQPFENEYNARKSEITSFIR